MKRGNASKGLPATDDALKAYAQRVLRPGQVQSFGVVMLIGSEESTSLSGASPGTILAVSANSEDLLGMRPEEMMVGLLTPLARHSSLVTRHSRRATSATFTPPCRRYWIESTVGRKKHNKKIYSPEVHVIQPICLSIECPCVGESETKETLTAGHGRLR